MDHVQISLEEYHKLKGDRDDFLDYLNCRIERQEIEIEGLKSAICIFEVRKNYGDNRYSEHICKNETHLSEAIKKYIVDDEELTCKNNELVTKYAKLRYDYDIAADTFFGKLAGLKIIKQDA